MAIAAKKKRSRPAAAIQPTRRITTAREAVELLHRETDGVIAFTSRFFSAFSRRADDIEKIGVLIRRHGADSCSINQFAGRDDADVSPSPTGPLIGRRTEYLRYICAAFVHINPREALEGKTVTGAIAAGLVPPPSITVTDVEGVTLLWLIRDDSDASRPPEWHDGRSKADSPKLYSKLQSILWGQLAPCGAMIDAKDAANVVRLPSDQVTWTVPRGTVPSYTISDLFEALGVPQPKRRQKRPREQSIPMPKNVAQQKILKNLHERHARILQRIARMRRGFTDEQRKHAVRWLAGTMEQQTKDRNAIIDAVAEFNKRWCLPPLTPRQLRKATMFRPGIVPVTDQHINAWFSVTPAEAAKLGLKKPSRYKTDDELRPKPTDRERIRAALLKMRDRDGKWPAARAAADKLRRLGFRKASPSTVWRHITALKAAEISTDQS